MSKNQVAKIEENKVVNPYAQAVQVQGPGTAVAQVDTHRAMIEVMTSFEVAKRFPRDMVEVANKILKECERPTLAEIATYSFPKGGQTIEGPTIRLMEAIARAHGNIRFGWEVLESTKQKSSIRAFAIDLENNTLRDTRFDCRHWRDTKQGGYAITDERDIYELQANMAMRRVRGCLQGLIAGDIIEMALSQCEATSKQNIDTSPEGIKKIVNAFKEFGVNAAMIEAKNGGLKVEAMRAPQIVVLRKIYAGLRDGIGKVEDYFDATLADKKEGKKSGIKEAVEDKKKSAPKKYKEKQEGKENSPHETIIETPDEKPEETPFQRIKRIVETADSGDDLYHTWTKDLKEEYEAVKRADPQQGAELFEIYKTASKKFEEA
jgi:hypothetical protein